MPFSTPSVAAKWANAQPLHSALHDSVVEMPNSHEKVPSRKWASWVPIAAIAGLGIGAATAIWLLWSRAWRKKQSNRERDEVRKPRRPSVDEKKSSVDEDYLRLKGQQTLELMLSAQGIDNVEVEKTASLIRNIVVDDSNFACTTRLQMAVVSLCILLSFIS